MSDKSIYKPTNTWITETTVTYYKMMGYYVSGSTYETYVVNGVPSPIPPSGHTLVDVIIISSWQE